MSLRQMNFYTILQSLYGNFYVYVIVKEGGSKSDLTQNFTI